MAGWRDNRGIERAPDFIRGLPLEKALDSATLLAYQMNGEALTVPHGFPVRVVVPGWGRRLLGEVADAHPREQEPAWPVPLRRAAIAPAPGRPVTPRSLVSAADTVLSCPSNHSSPR